MIDLLFAGVISRMGPTVFDPRLIEFINGSAFVVHLAMSIVCGRYVWLCFVDFDVSWKTYRRVEGSLSVTVLSIGLSIVRACFYALRFLQNHGINPGGLETYLALGAIIGAYVTILGGICAVRVFAHPDHGNWPWALTALGVVAVGGMAFM